MTLSDFADPAQEPRAFSASLRSLKIVQVIKK
jgi:hypothetical protein